MSQWAVVKILKFSLSIVLFAKWILNIISRYISSISISKNNTKWTKYVFNNWSMAQVVCPQYMSYVRNKQDITQFVLKAKKDKKKVRCAAYGHSFSPLFGDDSSYMCMLVPYQCNLYSSYANELSFNSKYYDFEWFHEMQRYSDDLSHTWIDKSISELMYIRPVELFDKNYKNNYLQIGAATPIWMYYNWCEKRLMNKLPILSEPDNVTQLHQTFVGIINVGSHGAEIHTPPLCDYLIEMKLIDANGDELIFNRNNCNMNEICVNLGLLGIIYEITIEFEDMYYVSYKEKMVQVNDFFDKEINCMDKLCNNQDLKVDHLILLWYPMSKYVQMKMWKKYTQTSDNYKCIFYPSKSRKLQQHVALSFARLLGILYTYMLQYWLFIDSNHTKSKLTKYFIQLRVRLFYLVNSKTIIKHINNREKNIDNIVNELKIKGNENKSDVVNTYSVCGIHKTAGIEYHRLAFDFAIAFPLKVDKISGKIDTSIANKLYKAGIDLYQSKVNDCGYYPYVGTQFILRIKKGCSSKLGLTYGMEYGVIIETGCDLVTKQFDDSIVNYTSELCNIWVDIYSKYDASNVENIRTHWGKSFENIEINGQTWFDIIKKTYKREIDQFNQIRLKVDPNKMFINDMLADIFDKKTT